MIVYSAGKHATLTPANALTRLALSDAYDALTAGRQKNPRDGSPLCRMQVDPTQVCDEGVHQLQRELGRRLRYEGYSDGFTSDSLTEPSEGEAAASIRELGMIWTGRYLLGFQPPSVPELGLTAGKGRLPRSSADLLLCTVAFAKKHGINLRTLHARFNFDLQNRALFIAGKSSSQHAELAVNGAIVGGWMFTLSCAGLNGIWPAPRQAGKSSEHPGGMGHRKSRH